ncbi:MAG: hypothetical protein AMXMBFR64_17460 [Myxococcales bacterium]
MAVSSYNASVRQGFNFEKDSQVCVGFINSLKIGDTAMTSDLSVTDPENVTATIKVFGVVSSMFWQGGYTDPVQTACQVSNDSKNKIATLVHSTLSNTEVEIEFTVYDYDPKNKKYFKAFHCNATKLKGLVAKSGGELHMAIDNDASYEVASPKNFAFNLGVMPQDSAQQIHVAVSLTDKFAKAWGLQVG